MTDFELQRRLRDLNAPRAPQDDPWPQIAARIGIAAARTQPPRRRFALPLAAAAALLIALTGVFQLSRRPPPSGVQQARVERPISHDTILSPSDAEAFARTRGTDPRLAGAAVVLDAARAELEQAMEERPDAAFLVGLLARTHARQVKLEHYGARAG